VVQHCDSSMDPLRRPWILVAGIVGIILVWLLVLGLRRRPFLQPDKFRAAQLVEKETVTHNTNRYRFALPRGTTLGLPVGQHISFKFQDQNGREVMRSYTPVTGNETVGYVDFVIKVYPQGQMSQHVDCLRIHDSILMRGPKGQFKYLLNMKRSIGVNHSVTQCRPLSALPC
jgi:cytochrome-b5 reductase